MLFGINAVDHPELQPFNGSTVVVHGKDTSAPAAKDRWMVGMIGGDGTLVSVPRKNLNVMP